LSPAERRLSALMLAGVFVIKIAREEEHGNIPLRGGMRWYGGNGGQDLTLEFRLGGGEMLVADSVVDLPEALALLEAASDGDTVVELVAGELDLLAEIVVLEETDEVPGRKSWIIQDFERALDGEMADLLLEARDFLGIECGRRRGRGLLAAPLEDVGAVEAPDGHAGGFDAVAFAEIGALLPAIAGAGRRVIEGKEQFVAEGDGPAVGVLGVLQPVIERFDARDFQPTGAWLGFVGFGGRRKCHPAILRQVEERRYHWECYLG
jgi:hypothetical protein